MDSQFIATVIFSNKLLNNLLSNNVNNKIISHVSVFIKSHYSDKQQSMQQLCAEEGLEVMFSNGNHRASFMSR